MTDKSKDLAGAILLTIICVIISVVAATAVSKALQLTSNYTEFIVLIAAILGTYVGIMLSSFMYGAPPIDDKCSHERCVNKAEPESKFCKDCVPMGAQECSGCNQVKS